MMSANAVDMLKIEIRWGYMAPIIGVNTSEKS